MGRKPFFLLQIVLLYLKWHGQSIKYYHPSWWKEGWIKLGFKSHRLPYGQQQFKTYSKYNSESNIYSNLDRT